MIVDDIGYGGPAQAHLLVFEAVQSVFIGADHIGICADGSPQPGHPRSAGSFVKVLPDYVGAPPKMSMERVLRRGYEPAAE